MDPLSIVDGIALIRFATGKANAIDAEFLATLNALLDRAAQQDARALVITGHDKYFSGGLAVPALVELDRPRMTQFLEQFYAAMLRLFAWPTPVVAAINGHAVAGGCVIALQADVRIMAAAAGKIGLNEAQLGVGLPALVVESLRLQVPAPALLPIALEGKLFAPDEARALGLVHEVVAPEQLETRALERARELATLPASGFSEIKHSVRRPAIEIIERTARQDTERWLDNWFSPTGRQLVGQIVTLLTDKTRR